MRNDAFRSKVVLESLKKYAPEKLPPGADPLFHIHFINENEFTVESNIDFLEPGKFAVTTPLLTLVNTCEDLKVMTDYEAEICVPDFNARMLRVKTNEILNQRIHAQQEIDGFSQFVFDKSWALREAINERDVKLKDIITVIRKAAEFKDWLYRQPPDSNIMREYVAKISEKSILQTLQAKAIKMYVYVGIAGMATALSPEAGLAISAGLTAFDTFIYDQLGKKWKPSQFIEDDLRPLLKNKP